MPRARKNWKSDFRLGTAAELRDFAARNEAQETAAHEREVRAAAGAEGGADAMPGAVRAAQGLDQPRPRHREPAACSSEISEQDAQWKERTQQGVQDAGAPARRGAGRRRRRPRRFPAARWHAADQALAQLESSARSAFRGYGKFRRLLAPGPALAGAGPGPGSQAPCSPRLQQLRQKIEAELARFKKSPLPLIFKFLPVWLVAAALLGVAAADPVGAHLLKRQLVTDFAAGLAAGGICHRPGGVFYRRAPGGAGGAQPGRGSGPGAAVA